MYSKRQVVLFCVCVWLVGFYATARSTAWSYYREDDGGIEIAPINILDLKIETKWKFAYYTYFVKVSSYISYKI